MFDKQTKSVIFPKYHGIIIAENLTLLVFDISPPRMLRACTLILPVKHWQRRITLSGIFTKVSDVFRSDADKKIHPFTSAVILCAGIGERFSDNKNITKQNVLLCGIPVAVHTLMAFEYSALVDEVVIVVRSEEIDIFNEYCTKYKLSKVTQIVPGGNTRQESSLCGFDSIDDRAKYVLIHDGARCLITPKTICDTVRCAYEFSAAAAAEKSRDTVKYADNNGVVETTIDREHVWLVKTPQVFLANMYRAALTWQKKTE